MLYYNCCYYIIWQIRLAIRQKFKLQSPKLLLQKHASILNRSIFHDSPSSINQRIFLKICQQAFQLVKGQVELLQTHLGIYEIMYIVFLIFWLTSEIFRATVTILEGKAVANLNLLPGVFWLGKSCVRLLLKCYLAEMITIEVNLI